MKRRLFLAAMLAAATGVLADNVARVTAVGGTTTDYATIETALAACSGGETVTLLGDVSVASALSISKPVILDLDGHTLSNRSGWFIKPTTEADGLVIRNGTVSSADCCIVFENSTSTIYATNVTFRGVCTLYGRSAGLVEFQEGCVSRTTFFCSSSSFNGCAMNVRGGVVAPGTSIYDRVGAYNTILTVYAGSFTQNPEFWVAADRVVLAESHTVQGIACSYRVREATAADVNACVISADGSEVSNFSTFLAAFGASGDGETVRLFTDVTLPATIAVTKRVAIDLNGHSLATTTHLFDMGAGADGFAVMNGICQTQQSFVTNRSTFAAGTVMVSNCTVHAQFLAMGRNGTVSCVDDVVTCDFLTSESSALAVRMTNATVAVKQSVTAGASPAPASIVLSRGRYSFDATTYLATGFSQVLEDYDLNGTNCRFKVLPTEDAGTLDAALVISADGTTTNAHATIAEAVSECPAGGTVRLLQSCTVSGELSIPRTGTPQPERKLHCTGVKRDARHQGRIRLRCRIALQCQRERVHDGECHELHAFGDVSRLGEGNAEPVRFVHVEHVALRQQQRIRDDERLRRLLHVQEVEGQRLEYRHDVQLPRGLDHGEPCNVEGGHARGGDHVARILRPADPQRRILPACGVAEREDVRVDR